MTKTKPADGFSAARSDLHPALQRVALGRSRRDIIPILGAVLIEYGDGSVTLTCTDTEQSVTTSLQATTRGGGKVAVSVVLLAEIVAGLPGDAMIDVATTPSRSVLRSGRAQIALPGLPVDEFPSFDPGMPEGSATVEGAALADVIGRANTLTVASEEDGKVPALGRVLLDLNGKAHVVACDRYRLLHAPLTVEQGTSPLEGQFILPKTAVSLVKLLANEKTVTLAGTRDRLVLSTLTTTIVTRLSSHRYPDTATFFAADVVGRVTVDVAPLLAAIARVASVADGKIAMEFGPDELRLTCSTNKGESEDSVPIESDVTDTIIVKMNPRLLTTVLAAIAEPRIVFDIGGPEHPLRIRSADEKVATRGAALPMRA